MKNDGGPAKIMRRHVTDAAEALTDLNVFAAIVALLESGLNHSPTYKTAGRIINICNAEQQKCLRRYDDARAKAENLAARASDTQGEGE